MIMIIITLLFILNLKIIFHSKEYLFTTNQIAYFTYIDFLLINFLILITLSYVFVSVESIEINLDEDFLLLFP